MKQPTRQSEVEFIETKDPLGMLGMWVDKVFVNAIERISGVALVRPAGAPNYYSLALDARYDEEEVKQAIVELVAKGKGDNNG